MLREAILIRVQDLRATDLSTKVTDPLTKTVLVRDLIKTVRSPHLTDLRVPAREDLRQAVSLLPTFLPSLQTTEETISQRTTKTLIPQETAQRIQVVVIRTKTLIKTKTS